MAIRSVEGFLWPPPVSTGVTGGGVPVIDASGEKVAIIFRATEPCRISGVRFTLSSVTTGQTLRISLQNVGTDGNPDGTIDQSGTVSVADTDDFTPKSVVFDTPRHVNRGDLVACVIEFDSTVGNLAIQTGNVTSFVRHAAWAYIRHFFSAAWNSNSGYPWLSLDLDGGGTTKATGLMPAGQNTTGSISLSSAGSPDEAGNRFVLPFACVVSGVWISATSLQAAAATLELRLYDLANNVLASVSVDRDALVSGQNQLIADLPAHLSLPAAFVGRVAVLPDATALSLSKMDLDSNARLAAFGFGPGTADTYWTERTDAGAWTDINTRRGEIGLVVTGIDDGSGAGEVTWIPQGRAVGQPPPIILPG